MQNPQSSPARGKNHESMLLYKNVEEE